MDNITPGLYRTRDGREAVVRAVVTDYDDDYPVEGEIGAESCFWKRNGRNGLYRQRAEDLVERIGDLPVVEPVVAAIANALAVDPATVECDLTAAKFGAESMRLDGHVCPSPMMVTLPAHLTPEMIEAVRTDERTRCKEKDDMHQRIGWLLEAYAVIVESR